MKESVGLFFLFMVLESAEAKNITDKKATVD
jgi:hypothetical protein